MRERHVPGRAVNLGYRSVGFTRTAATNRTRAAAQSFRRRDRETHGTRQRARTATLNEARPSPAQRNAGNDRADSFRMGSLLLACSPYLV
jgi:hypothetical protein